MTVAEMRQRVSNREWVGWSVYYGRRAQREQMEIERAKARKGK